MRKSALIGLGVLLLIMGVIFGLQGVGTLGGSAMSGKTLWAVLGPIIAVVGLVMVLIGLRKTARPR